MDQVIAAAEDLFLKKLQRADGVFVGDHLGRDAEGLGLLGEGRVDKAHHIHLNVLPKALEQGVNVGFRAAGIAAADQMNDFHALPPKKTCIKR